MSTITLHGVDEEVDRRIRKKAQREGESINRGVKRLLREALPMNDVWIAAHAMETGSVLITYDANFQKAPGLRLWVR